MALISSFQCLVCGWSVILSVMSWVVSSWFVVWMIMEILLLVFFGCLVFDKSYMFTESGVKYFLVQVGLSVAFLGVSVISLLNISQSSLFWSLLIMVSKLGLFPFHFWLFSILGKMEWVSFLILSTFMKMPPIVLCFYSLSFFDFCFILAFSAGVGSVGGLGNLSVQKLIGYSSMLNLAWMTLTLGVGWGFFFFFFFIYFFIIGFLVYFFFLLGSYYFNQFFCLNYLVFVFSFFFLMSGFPPYVVFIVKWLVCSFYVLMNFNFFIVFILFFSFVVLLYYFNLFFFFLVSSNLSFKWFFSFNYYLFFLILLVNLIFSCCFVYFV